LTHIVITISCSNKLYGEIGNFTTQRLNLLYTSNFAHVDINIYNYVDKLVDWTIFILFFRCVSIAEVAGSGRSITFVDQPLTWVVLHKRQRRRRKQFSSDTKIRRKLTEYSSGMETVTVIKDELTTQMYANVSKAFTDEEINSFYFYEVSW